MEFGIIWSKIDEMDFVTDAEKLGFTHLWVTDSGLIRSDLFVMMTVAALRTTTMKIGTGVAVPGLRLAPVLAEAHAAAETAGTLGLPLVHWRGRLVKSVRRGFRSLALAAGLPVTGEKFNPMTRQSSDPWVLAGELKRELAKQEQAESSGVKEFSFTNPLMGKKKEFTPTKAKESVATSKRPNKVQQTDFDDDDERRDDDIADGRPAAT